jgi:hypothetical protein
MVNYQNNIEVDNKQLLPEQKLWRAVFNQALQDAFNDTYDYTNRLDKQIARDWMKDFNKDFADVCENAGFNPLQAFTKIKKYVLIRKGIVSK